MFWGDVDNDGLLPTGLTIASGDGARTHFTLGRAPARSVDEVRVDGAPVPPTAYAVHEGNGWISLAAPPPPGQGNVEIRYTWSADDDLGMTTWDSTRGNYIFLHQGVAAAPPAAEAVAAMTVAPNPMIGMTALRYRGTSVDRARVAVHDADGRLVRTLHDGPLPEGWISWQWDRRDEAGRIVGSGVYFARMEAAGATASRRLVVLK